MLFLGSTKTLKILEEILKNPKNLMKSKNLVNSFSNTSSNRKFLISNLQKNPKKRRLSDKSSVCHHKPNLNKNTWAKQSPQKGETRFKKPQKMYYKTILGNPGLKDKLRQFNRNSRLSICFLSGRNLHRESK
jgi:hypothetical protein